MENIGMHSFSLETKHQNKIIISNCDKMRHAFNNEWKCWNEASGISGSTVCIEIESNKTKEIKAMRNNIIFFFNLIWCDALIIITPGPNEGWPYLLEIIYDKSQNETREKQMNYLTELIVIKMREKLRNKFIIWWITNTRNKNRSCVWVGVRYVLNKQFTANIFNRTTKL